MVPNTRQSSGFTLLEILISVMILAIISTMTAISIQRSIRMKIKLDRDMAEFSSVRDALAIMSNDINKAFHWLDINESITQNAANNSNQQPISGPTPIPAEKLTAFIGAGDRLDFTTLSNVRTMKNAPESDQAEVGYFVKSVKSIVTGQSTNAVVRRVSTILDGDVEKGGQEFVLIENVKALKFRYLGGEINNEKKEWRDSWRSDRPDDANTSGKFPDAVEITLSVGHEDRVVEIGTVAVLEMPNNKPLPTPAPSPPPGGGNPR